MQKKIRVVVDNRLRLDLEEARSIFGDDGLRRLKKAFTHRNPMHFESLSKGYTPGPDQPPEIITWASNDDEINFPRGGTDRLRREADVSGAEIAWIDRRARGRPGFGAFIPDHRMPDGKVLREHQLLAIDTIVAKENCLVRSPTASGKSTIVLATIARLKVPSLILVWMTSLLDQWIASIVEELGIKKRDVGVIHRKRRRIRPVTVAMIQTLDSQGVDDDLRKTFGAVFMDEVQRLVSPSTLRVFTSFPARYLVGVSDQEKRTDGKEAVTYDALGQVAVDIPVSDLEEKGIVLPVQVRAVPTTFRAPWTESSASFDALFDGRAGDSDDRVRLLTEMADDPQRDALVRRIVRTEVNHGSQVLVLTLQVKHALDLRERLTADGHRVGLLVGHKAMPLRDFRESVAGLLSGELRVAVGTVQKVGVGQNLPHLSAGILALPIGKKKPYLFRQIRGRFSRAPAGKTRAVLYVPVDVEVSAVGTAMISTLNRWNDGNVVVLVDGRWVSVAEYAAARRRRRREQLAIR